MVAKTVGDADKALGDGDRLDAAYELPFLAHATMEPLNCTVHVTPDGCELWIGTQIMARVQSTVAAALGLPPEKVTVHQHLLGGGFGRRLEPDMAIKAARIAQHVDGPVKVVYSREEDIQHDVYRPVYRDLLAASLKDGKIDGWTHRITGSSVVARWLPAAFQGRSISTPSIARSTCPTTFPTCASNMCDASRRACSPASGAASAPTTMSSPSKASWTSWRTRRARIRSPSASPCWTGTPRLKSVVQLAAQKSGWGGALPARTGRGICAQISFASFIATVCEAEVDDNGEVKLRRVVSVVDTGIAVNPDTVIAQLQGGLVFGLTAALYGEITIAKGRVQQSNFHDYRMLRINEVPNIEVHVVKSGEAARRHRRNRRHRFAALAGQCAVCRDRHPPAPPAGRSRRAGGKEAGMKRALLLVLLVVVLVVAGFGGWIVLGPGPLDFAGGSPVLLADYKGADPTGVPASLRNATPGGARRISGPRRRLRSLSHRQGRRALRRRAGLQPALRHALFAQHHARQETGIGNWSDADFLNAVHKGIAAGRHAALSRLSLRRLYDDDRRDALAIKAFLFSLPARHAPTPANTLAFPFNQRWLMAFWSAFFNSDKRF